MHAYHGDGIRVGNESPTGIMRRIADVKGNGLPSSVQLGLWYAIRVPHHNLCRLAVYHLRGSRVVIAVRSAGLSIKLVARAARRMAQTVIQCHDGKQKQSADLNNIDAYVHRSRTVDSAMSHIGHGK